jgi:hypothetical protein
MAQPQAAREVGELPAMGFNRWPISAIVATYWVKHGSGPEPDFAAVSDALRFGLIDLSDGWTVTESGDGALREHGWL